ncbi:NAD+ diphosphatase [Nocardioides albertanoniae]|uniref:NAD(+) diphosphatase n=1 Tax=Nocardioides albertanoniae TaxID=1175486 RepID=A0A543A431_9ACTN|nr:NAD(+) diphosphatase [Nocardioides albertanoniae]TQL67349.1 NAD+ diphosphatase [Nocardioides albertanoniae]
MDAPNLPIHQRLTQDPHDRTGHLRTDDDWVQRAWADPATKVLVVAGNRVEPAGETGVRWRTPAAAPAGIRLLLGDSPDGARFAVLASREESGEGWLDLRGLFPAMLADTTEASLLMHAVGLAEWHRATRFCSRCGGGLEPRSAGHELVCAEGHVTFPRTDPAVIMLVTTGEPGSDEERCLLGNHTRWPMPYFSTLAGFVEPGEALEDTVRREVAEEVGVRIGQVDFFGNQPWPLPASLMLGYFARAESTEITVDADEIREARWFTRADLAAVAESGEVKLPSGVSISRSLVEEWYGGELPGSW